MVNFVFRILKHNVVWKGVLVLLSAAQAVSIATTAWDVAARPYKFMASVVGSLVGSLAASAAPLAAAVSSGGPPGFNEFLNHTAQGEWLESYEVPVHYIWVSLGTNLIVALIFALNVVHWIVKLAVLLVKLSDGTNDLKRAALEAVVNLARPGVGKDPGCQVRVKVGGTFSRQIGNGVRIGRWLVVPTHVLGLVKDEILLETDNTVATGREVRIPVSTFTEVYADISAVGLSEAIWSKLAAKKTSTSYNLEGFMSVTSFGTTNYGAFKVAEPDMFVKIDANTVPGFSGAAYMDSGAILGIHLGSMTDGKNGGITAAFLEVLLKNHSSISELENAGGLTTSYEDDIPDDDSKRYNVGGKSMKRSKGGKWVVDDKAAKSLKEEIDRQAEEEARFQEMVERAAEEKYLRLVEKMNQKGWSYDESKLKDNSRKQAENELRFTGGESAGYLVPPVGLKKWAEEYTAVVGQRMSQLEDNVSSILDQLKAMANKGDEKPAEKPQPKEDKVEKHVDEKPGFSAQDLVMALKEAVKEIKTESKVETPKGPTPKNPPADTRTKRFVQNMSISRFKQLKKESAGAVFPDPADEDPSTVDQPPKNGQSPRSAEAVGPSSASTSGGKSPSPYPDVK